MLTEQEMRDAYFADICDADPDYPGEVSARMMAWDTPVLNPETDEVDVGATALREAELVKRYRSGKEVLRRWDMRVSQARTTVPFGADGRLTLPVPEGAPYIVVKAGHIAESPAYRAVYFTPRLA